MRTTAYVTIEDKVGLVVGKPFVVKVFDENRNTHSASFLTYPEFSKVILDGMKAEYSYLRRAGGKSALFDAIDKMDEEHQMFMQDEDYQKANKGL